MHLSKQGTHKNYSTPTCQPAIINPDDGSMRFKCDATHEGHKKGVKKIISSFWSFFLS